MGKTASGGIRVTGLREAIVAMQALGVSVEDLKEAMGGISAKAASLARSFAPQDTGTLAASIRGNRAKNKAVVIGGKGKSLNYARVQNYGWPTRNIPASRFMQRADDAIRPSLVPTLEAEIERLITEHKLG